MPHLYSSTNREAHILNIRVDFTYKLDASIFRSLNGTVVSSALIRRNDKKSMQKNSVKIAVEFHKKGKKSVDFV